MLRRTVVTRGLSLFCTLTALGCGAETSAPGAAPDLDGGQTDSGAASDTTSSDAGSVVAPGACAGLRDDFSGSTLDLTRWRTVGFMGWTPEVAGGRLTLTPVAGYTNTRTGVVQSSSLFRLEECAVSIEVVRALPATLAGELNVAVNGAGAFMRVSRGRLQTVTTVAGKPTEAFVPYDPVAQRWWRFRESAGVLHLETSPDARSWTERMKAPHDTAFEAVQLGLNAITTTTEAFEAPQFDNVNVTP